MNMKTLKSMAVLMLTLTLCLSMAACGSSAGSEDPQNATSTADPNKKVLLVVSFGTSYNESREATIGAIETSIAKAYPDFEMRRAFTSQIIIDKLKDRDGLEIDNVQEAMERMVADGVGTLVVQPTHVMSGLEYDEMIAAIEPFKDKFVNISYGLPLLTSDEDYAQVVSIITDETKEYDVDGTAIVFMGHGTEHEANSTYTKLQQFLTDAGYDNYFIGTVEATPSLEDVMASVEESGATKVVLLPLMIVAGDHANNDMAGDEEGSWKTAFKGSGYEVECVIKGLGEYSGIQQMFVKHAGDAIK